MKRKQRLTLNDWNRIPSAPVKQEVGYDRTLADYTRRIASEEQQNLNTTQKGLTKSFWGRPLAEIGNPKVWREDGAYDQFVGLSDGRFDSMSIDRAFTEFLHRSHTLTGYVLDEDGSKRLCWFGLSQATHGKELSTPEAWVKCFDRLLECDAFTSGEIVFHEGTKRVAYQPHDERPTMGDLLSVNVENRGFQKAAQIADSLYFDERQGIVKQWFDSLASNFSFTISVEQAKKCKEWFEKNNRSFFTPRNYDDCRLWAVKSGLFPPRCLSSDDRRSQAIEEAETAHMTPHQRRELFRRLGQ
jgi:hypothetical protein